MSNWKEIKEKTEKKLADFLLQTQYSNKLSNNLNALGLQVSYALRVRFFERGNYRGKIIKPEITTDHHEIK